MTHEELSPELKAKVAECKSAEELAKLAKAEGVELTDEQLEALSGGSDWNGPCNNLSPISPR